MIHFPARYQQLHGTMVVLYQLIDTGDQVYGSFFNTTEMLDYKTAIFMISGGSLESLCALHPMIHLPLQSTNV